MKISQTAIKLILAITALSILIGGVAIAFYNNLMFAGGVAYGGFFGAIKVIITERSIEHTLNLNDPKSADAHAKIQYIIRYFVSGAVLVVAVFIDRENFLYGAMAGILLTQPAGYIIMFLESTKKIKKSKAK